MPSDTRPRGPEMDRPRLHNPSTAYHEAGHAIAFWHHGIRFEYVTLRPRNPANSGHLYARRSDAEDPAGMEVEMHLWAAGDVAHGRIFRLTAVPTDQELLRRFSRHAANPDDPWLSVDQSRFIKTALKRDAAIQASDPLATVGPESWLRIWRDTEQMIRHDLWPAVYAVAWEMVFSSRALTCPEIAEIAEIAMRQHAADFRRPPA